MLRDELVDRLRALPAGADVGVRIGDGNLEILDVFPWGKGQYGALSCRPGDLKDLFVEWGLTAEHRRRITLGAISAQGDGGRGPALMAAEDAAGRKLRIVGVEEIQELLGVSAQRTARLTGRADFPEPIALLGSGKVWDVDDVEEWRKAREGAGGDVPGTA